MEGPPSDRGVNYRALGELFELIQEGNPRKTAGYSYEIKLSVVEIYNDTVRIKKERERTEKRKMQLAREECVYLALSADFQIFFCCFFYFISIGGFFIAISIFCWFVPLSICVVVVCFFFPIFLRSDS